MDQTPRVIDDQIHATRMDLVEHIQALEDRFGRKVIRPAHKAAKSVESVKESLSSATQFLDAIRDQVDERPWLTLALSVAAGFGGGKLLQLGLRTEHSNGQFHVVPTPMGEPQSPSIPAPVEMAPAEPPKQQEESSDGALAAIQDDVIETTHEIASALQSVAVDAAKGFAWGLLARALPDFFEKERVDDVAPNLRSERTPAGVAEG